MIDSQGSKESDSEVDDDQFMEMGDFDQEEARKDKTIFR